MTELELVVSILIGCTAGAIGVKLLCYAPKWAAGYFVVFALVLYIANEMLK